MTVYLKAIFSYAVWGERSTSIVDEAVQLPA